ncbi:hypothetical protein E1293_45745 [Actinomadura darangshiensis]|uniref:Uncharacterized protein n=1 Tax=Actinomadura darangshiensis TaxID=705336 RepID=A0A4R4ZNJ3_9ACTN|nr:hypothetical protein E1293_45745 [Actinomadura darangshiensis]
MKRVPISVLFATTWFATSFEGGQGAPSHGRETHGNPPDDRPRPHHRRRCRQRCSRHRPRRIRLRRRLPHPGAGQRTAAPVPGWRADRPERDLLQGRKGDRDHPPGPAAVADPCATGAYCFYDGPDFTGRKLTFRRPRSASATSTKLIPIPLRNRTTRSWSAATSGRLLRTPTRPTMREGASSPTSRPPTLCPSPRAPRRRPPHTSNVPKRQP